MSENTIQVNDVNEQKDAPAKEVELPVLNNEKKTNTAKAVAAACAAADFCNG